MVLRPFIHYSSFYLIILLFLLNCDSTINPQSVASEKPFIRSIDIDPSVVQFSLESDGYRDTTLLISLTSEIILNGSSEEPSYIVTNLANREIITSGKLTDPQSNVFTTNFELSTTTTQFQNYMVQLYAFDESGNSNTAEHTIELRGFSNSRPQILMVSNPEEINRPATGEITTQFTAKATDLDGQNTIERVMVRILDILGSEVPDSPFQMFDDGTTYEDAAASDSVYSITFPIAAIPDLATQSFFLEYFAVDQGGTYSDTTRTIFKITNNQ